MAGCCLLGAQNWRICLAGGEFEEHWCELVRICDVGQVAAVQVEKAPAGSCSAVWAYRSKVGRLRRLPHPGRAHLLSQRLTGRADSTAGARGAQAAPDAVFSGSNTCSNRVGRSAAAGLVVLSGAVRERARLDAWAGHRVVRAVRLRPGPSGVPGSEGQGSSLPQGPDWGAPVPGRGATRTPGLALLGDGRACDDGHQFPAT